MKILHLAPEPVFARALSHLPNLRYTSADRAMGRVDVRADVTKLPFRDGAFDVLLCIHVLEHIPDDGTAMRELCRVLHPAGWSILQVPLHPDRARTFENATIVSPEERRRAFGQEDHVRRYGFLDYKRELDAAGFDVTIEPYARELDAAAIRRQGLLVEDIYLCRRRPGPMNP